MMQKRNEFDTVGSTNKSSTSSSTSSSSTSSSTGTQYCSTSTTTVNTEPGVSLDEARKQWDLRCIAGAYQSILGQMNMRVAMSLERFYDDGMDADVITHAIEQTGWAPRPSAHYLHAILSRYARQGIRSMAAVLHDEQEWAAQKIDPDAHWWA